MVREAIEKGAYTYLFKPLNKMDIFSLTVKSLKNTAAGAHVNTFETTYAPFCVARAPQSS